MRCIGSAPLPGCPGSPWWGDRAEGLLLPLQPPVLGRHTGTKPIPTYPTPLKAKIWMYVWTKTPSFTLEVSLTKQPQQQNLFAVYKPVRSCPSARVPEGTRRVGGKFVIVHINVYYLRKRVQIQTSDSGSPHRAVRMRRKINNLCVFLRTEQEKSFCFKVTFSVRSPLAPCRLCFPSRIDYTVRWVI